MESDSTHTLQPVSASPSAGRTGDISAVLRAGRLLAGRVQQVLPDGIVVLQAVGQRFAARSQLALTPGEVLLFRTELAPGGWVLRVVTPEATHGPLDLRQALLSLVAYDRPLSEALAELRGELQRLAQDPRQGHASARALLAGLEAHAFHPGDDGAVLRGVLLRSGLWQETQLLALEREPAATSGLREPLARDLKSQLLAALADLPEGELREATLRTLKSLEAEQLLHIARQERGEASHYFVPVDDGSQWQGAHLRVERRSEGRKNKERSQGEPPLHRATLAVDFSRLGPLCIDIALSGTQLQLRLRATDAATVDLLRAEQPEWLAHLERGGLRAQAVVGLTTPDAVAAELRAPSPTLLGEQPLMDVSA
jgi:hypothetical protein